MSVIYKRKIIHRLSIKCILFISVCLVVYITMAYARNVTEKSRMVQHTKKVEAIEVGDKSGGITIGTKEQSIGDYAISEIRDLFHNSLRV